MKTMKPINRSHRAGVASLVTMAAISMACTAQAPDPPEVDISFAIDHLEMSRAALLDEVDGLSEEQWHFRESPERWSAAEIVEHLALAEDFLFSIIVEQVMRTPRQDAHLPGVPDTDVEVVEMAADRSQRFEAPEPIQPTTRFATPGEAIGQLLAARERTIEFVRNTPDARFHVMAAPGGIERDALQWTLFISGHMVRHTDQLLQVKRDPGFPAG